MLQESSPASPYALRAHQGSALIPPSCPPVTAVPTLSLLLPTPLLPSWASFPEAVLDSGTNPFSRDPLFPAPAATVQNPPPRCVCSSGMTTTISVGWRAPEIPLGKVALPCKGAKWGLKSIRSEGDSWRIHCLDAIDLFGRCILSSDVVLQRSLDGPGASVPKDSFLPAWGHWGHAIS